MAENTDKTASRKPAGRAVNYMEMALLFSLILILNVCVFFSLVIDTAFKQQRLKAWQPILTASTALPVFFIVGIVFVPIGAVLLVASDGVSTKAYDVI